MCILQVNMAAVEPTADHFKLLYFAAASSYTQKTSEFLPLPMTVSELPDKLEERYPGIKQKILSSCALTINLEYIDLDEASTAIKIGDEVAIIPPVSSG
jgi:molybdopterin synthase sulfur carrier subunit